MKTCKEIYLEKSKEIIDRLKAHRDSIYICKQEEEIDIKIDAIMEFLSQPELMNPIMFYNPMNDFCNCYELKPGMSIPTKDDMKTCDKCNKPLRMI